MEHETTYFHVFFFFNHLELYGLFGSFSMLATGMNKFVCVNCSEEIDTHWIVKIVIAFFITTFVLFLHFC